MELKTCNNGHIYDPSITPECPECAKMKGKTVPLDGGMDDYGKTEPIHKPTEPVNQGNHGHWAQVDQYGKVPFESEDYTPTRPVGYPSGKEERGDMSCSISPMSTSVIEIPSTSASITIPTSTP